MAVWVMPMPHLDGLPPEYALSVLKQGFHHRVSQRPPAGRWLTLWSKSLLAGEGRTPGGRPMRASIKPRRVICGGASASK